MAGCKRHIKTLTMGEGQISTGNPVPDLSSVIIYDILSRLEVKHIGRLRCTCKEWCDLTVEPDFIQSHLKRSSPHLLLHSYDDLQYTIMNEVDLISNRKVSSLSRKYSFARSELNSVARLTVVGSCNGLLCILQAGYPNGRIDIYNPMTGEYSTIPDLPLNYIIMTVGFGFDELNNKYKVFVQNKTRECNIITVGEGSWRTLSHPDLEFEDMLSRFQKAHFFNGSLHWLLDKRFVVSLDICHESIRTLNIPASIMGDVEVPSRLLNSGNSLTLVYEKTDSVFDSGVTSIWDVNDSDFHEQGISSIGPVKRVLCKLTDGSILLQRRNQYLEIYYTEEMKTRPLAGPIRSGWEVIFFTPSLVSIKALTADANSKSNSIKY